MGGNAAKERRRLKRLEKNQQDSEIEDTRNNDNYQESGLAKSEHKKLRDNVNKNQGAKKHHMSLPSNEKVKLKNKRGSHASEKRGKSNFSPHNRIDRREKKFITPKPKKAFKKPKHLKRKIENLSQSISDADKDNLAKLQAQEKKLNDKKEKNRARFREKVINLVGGIENFSAEAYNDLLERGGASIEYIVETVRIDNSVINKNDTEIDKSNDVQGMKTENHSDACHLDNKDNTGTTSTNENKRSGGAEENLVNNANVIVSTGANLSSTASDEEKEITPTSESILPESDEEDDISMQGQKRQRGRKRKGRQDSDAKREKLNIMYSSKKLETNTENTANTSSNVPQIPPQKRRCKGRKALTDFTIGKRFDGKVTYVKPTLGVFIDIGCHIDAFCHISRISDEFVKEITPDIYKQGDEVQARVVDMDRKGKKITVSLQSDAMMNQELQSAKQYRERMNNANNKSVSEATTGKSSLTSNEQEIDSEHKLNSDKITHAVKDINHSLERQNIEVDPSNMNPAELKRMRKLQRRAERRMQKELTGISA
mmetsp:Transcript_1918/g.2768  ORF Transcript_1918/g.2768 Transcript_1918/m.2768 type:complete len:542 (+) Transcript_1918:37-1662(+)